MRPGDYRRSFRIVTNTENHSHNSRRRRVYFTKEAVTTDRNIRNRPRLAHGSRATTSETKRKSLAQSISLNLKAYLSLTYTAFLIWAICSFIYAINPTEVIVNIQNFSSLRDRYRQTETER